MELGKILAKIGTSIIRDVVPGGGMILGLVNEFLPKDKKLPVNATGEQVVRVVNTLTPADQALIYRKELDVEIAEVNSWTQVQQSLSEADKAGASTRPAIAVMMAKIVSFVVIAYSTALIIAILSNHVSMIDSLKETWPLVLTIIATPVLLLRAYFGMRSNEKKARYGAAAGQPQSSGVIQNLLSGLGK